MERASTIQIYSVRKTTEQELPSGYGGVRSDYDYDDEHEYEHEKYARTGRVFFLKLHMVMHITTANGRRYWTFRE
jgi:hypothetical protein